MIDNNPNLNIKDNKTQTATNAPEIESQVATDQDDALKAFLERDTADVVAEKNKKAKTKKLSKSALWVIIGIIAVVIVAGIIVMLKVIPSTPQDSEFDEGTDITLSVDENGEHQAKLELNENGKLENNSYGTLIEYTPSDIKQIDIENQSGSYTIVADTPITTDENGEESNGATVYTLVGYEDIELQSGVADSIASDVAAVEFSSVADTTGEKASEFGFDSPRSTIKTQFTDGTTSTIIVGSDAPAELGTYLMFGDSKAVYIVERDSADGFLFSILDMITLTVNSAATDTDNSLFETLILSGTGFSNDIEIRPNEDKAIDSSYVMISPYKMFVSEVETANISGAIRGIYADEAVCVNPSDSQLSSYGLSSPYATVTAIYPDTTVHISASKPKDGNVYIISDSNIIYKISDSSVPWVNTNMDKLTPDVVIDPNFESLSKIVVKDSSGTYTFDVITTTDTVETTDGQTEEVTTTTAKYKGKALDSDNFRVFYQNIGNMQNAGKANESVSGEPTLTIELSYSTGRDADVVSIYETGNTKYTATLNGRVQSLVYKSYCTKFSQCVQDLINGRTVSSF